MSPRSCCILLFTLQKACYTRSVCFVPAKRLFIVVNVVFVVFPPQQATRERVRRREVVPIVWRISFSRRRGRVARGKPLGLRPPLLRRAGGRVSDWCRRGCKSRGYKQTFCCSLGREACRPAPWVNRPGCRRPRRYPGSRWPSGPSACVSSAASCRRDWRDFQGWRGFHPG